MAGTPNSTAGTGLQNLSSNQAIRLLAFAKGIDLSKTGDVAMPVINSNSWFPTAIITANASASLSSAQAGIYTKPGGASGGGNTLFTAAALSSNNTTTIVIPNSVATTAAQTAQTIYFDVTTLQAGVTVDCYIYGYDFS